MSISSAIFAVVAVFEVVVVVLVKLSGMLWSLDSFVAC